MRNYPVVWVTPNQVEDFDTAVPLPKDFGAKASGLASLPKAWIPEYFVLSPEFHKQFRIVGGDRKRDLLKSWAKLFRKAIQLAGMGKVEILLVRSNATHETLENRGTYKSFQCKGENLLETLQALFDTVDKVVGSEPIGVIVQVYVKPKLSGHLSNERRLKEEYRDALLETTLEPPGKIFTESVSFRRWRSQRGPDLDALICRDADSVRDSLREPLAYAAVHEKRLHFEWVWDGNCVYVVQADPDTDEGGGESPEVIVKKPEKVPEITGLNYFRIATKTDAEHSVKLKNHFLYASMGFPQPTLFVLDKLEVIQGLLGGKVDDRLSEDLVKLAARPLVIRTSCTPPPRSFLPRSDQLRSGSAAAAWLTGKFRETITQSDLQARNISLVAHHYIPALASAFSTGAPDNREVYIEALWGIPEGLYYYPYDGYFVDTQEVDANKLTDQSKDKFSWRDVKRHKSHFVAPNKLGEFTVHKTSHSWDWKNTIGEDSTPADIALFTRQLALKVGKRVNVMWFLGCAGWAGLPKTLPWYHNFDEVAVPTTGNQDYQRSTLDVVLELRTLRHLTELEKKAELGYKLQEKGRFVVTINPAEHEIIRDEGFATRVGIAAKSLNATVEVQGGILSHAYYALKRTGATVFARNRTDVIPHRVSFRKLVRDNVPDVVANKGEVAKIAHLTKEQLKGALKIKLVEEAFEARDANARELASELADVLEVVAALAEAADLSKGQIDKIRRKKREQRGGFRKGVMLVQTTPGSPSDGPDLFGDPQSTGEGRVVGMSNAGLLESAQQGAADVRRGRSFIELVNSASIDLSKYEWAIGSSKRVTVGSTKPSDVIEWSLAGKRSGSKLRLRLKIRLGEEQLELPLDFEPPGKAD